MVMDALRGYLQLANGVTEMSRQRATAMAKAMLSSPEATREQVATLANDLVEASKANRDAVASLVKYEVDRGLGRLGFATAEELTEMTARVRSLESEVRDLRQAVAAAEQAAKAAAQASEQATEQASEREKATGPARRSSRASATRKAPTSAAAVSAGGAPARKRRPAKSQTGDGDGAA